MWNRNYLVLVALLFVAAATRTSTPVFAEEADLIAVLRSDAGVQEKSAACQQLARIGTKQSVPALAALLADEKLSHMARYALEPIVDPSADEVLREALGSVQGVPLLGIIGSLGMRRDAEAIAPLAELLKKKDMASAAARALGNIGTTDAAKALQAALADATDAKSSICEGLLRCAEALTADDDTAAAQAIYDHLRELADAPVPVQAAALRGAILSRGDDGVSLLTEAIQGPDYGLAAAAVRAARESSSPKIADALLAELPKVPAERQGLLILALADRGDSRVLPAVLKAAESDDAALRILSFRALKQIGDASVAPTLVEAAAGDNADVAQAAMESLQSLQDESIDDFVVSKLSDAKGKMRLVLIDLAGRRRSAAAVTALWQAANDADADVRVAALTSLGKVLEPSDLSKLVARLGTSKTPAEAAALDTALRSVCLRAEDREAVAKQLADALATAEGPVQGRILESLSVVGGDVALETVAAAARSDKQELRDEAFRVLGSWKSADVAPLLLDLYKSETNERFKIRAVRAYIRIARQFSMPVETRAAMCRTALEIAERDADKQLVLEVLLRYPSDEMQAIALEAAENPALKDQALLVVMAMASKGINRADLGKALAQAGQTAIELEIINATYGAGEQTKDVTEILRKYAKSYRIIFLPSESYNESFEGDPADGIQKQLKISYRINGKEGVVSLGENATIILPMPK